MRERPIAVEEHQQQQSSHLNNIHQQVRRPRTREQDQARSKDRRSQSSTRALGTQTLHLDRGPRKTQQEKTRSASQGAREREHRAFGDEGRIQERPERSRKPRQLRKDLAWLDPLGLELVDIRQARWEPRLCRGVVE
ncbi:hypothetical protein BKA66DRAFT_464511 [Pyrenochaeta sp. MPI-SDFR-AT-0127]|nr:hypothetical protein BKA66DRAFT_464511 [Pyrenochaeta sp. MPI-SDFR-AT-0127]